MPTTQSTRPANRKSIVHYLDWYNRSRPHSQLKERTPDEAHAVMLSTVGQAASIEAEAPLKKEETLSEQTEPPQVHSSLGYMNPMEFDKQQLWKKSGLKNRLLLFDHVKVPPERKCK